MKFEIGDMIRARLRFKPDSEFCNVYGEVVSPVTMLWFNADNYYKIKLDDNSVRKLGFDVVAEYQELYLKEDAIELIHEEQPLICAAIDFLGENFASLPVIEKIAK